MSESDENPQFSSNPLFKQKSWSSSDSNRDEIWERRKELNRRSKSISCLSDDDLDELKGCIELGFEFDSPELDHEKLSDTLPALEFYYAVNKRYNHTVLKRTCSSSSMAAAASATASSNCSSDVSSPIGSPPTIIDPGDNPRLMKKRLKQWAQVVACSVKQSSCL